MKTLVAFAFLTLTTVAAPTLVHAQDAAAGKKLFNRCKACHTVNEGGRNGAGPNLWGLFGSTAAQRDNGYKKYSKTMKESGIVWTEETLSEFIENPRKAIPKTRMSFAGLKNPKQRADLIAYLKSVTQ